MHLFAICKRGDVPPGVVLLLHAYGDHGSVPGYHGSGCEMPPPLHTPPPLFLNFFKRICMIHVGPIFRSENPEIRINPEKSHP